MPYFGDLTLKKYKPLTMGNKHSQKLSKNCSLVLGDTEIPKEMILM